MSQARSCHHVSSLVCNSAQDVMQGRIGVPCTHCSCTQGSLKACGMTEAVCRHSYHSSKLAEKLLRHHTKQTSAKQKQFNPPLDPQQDLTPCTLHPELSLGPTFSEMVSFQKASQVTVLSCRISFHFCPV